MFVLKKRLSQYISQKKIMKNKISTETILFYEKYTFSSAKPIDESHP
jgi:hypothetical protein